MKFAIALSALLFSASASGTEIEVIPMNPIDCQQKLTRDASWVSATPSENGNQITLTAVITYGTCQLGQKKLSPIYPVNNMYVIDMEYSRDFHSDYSVTDPNTMTVTMTLMPEEYFSVQSVRHISLEFYPSSGTLHFGWNVIVARDPSTKKVSFQFRQN